MAYERFLVSILLLPALAAPIAAQDGQPAGPPPVTAQSSITLTLGTTADAEKRIIAYTCEGTDPFSVEYINAAPNFLALVPVGGQTMIFTAVMSGSGVRYAAGQYEWWTKGADATLHDLTQGADAAPIATCAEFSNIP